MTLFIRSLVLAALVLQTVLFSACAFADDRVKTANGIIEGTTVASGVREFKGIPYAQPPVGDLRWKEPQPVKNWKGTLSAKDFGPRAMQLPLFGDMVFRSRGMSEDCLYLNVWTPAHSDKERLPVLVYYFGGGFVGGDGSEPRYDGESMARKGIVAVTVTYRLGVFGFLAHPELTAESRHHASGNYGLLDQDAALRWVQKNIAAFGGDPKRITIGGESAGSISVSALMASPVSKDRIAGAIGESGSMMGALPAVPLTQAEENGVKFASSVGANTLADLRAMPADQLLQATARRGTPHIGPVLDGYFLPRPLEEIYAAGKQAHVPLLVGWNSQESGPEGVLGRDAPTPDNYAAAVRRLYGDRADDILRLYPGTTEDEARQSATDLASDRFIAFSTWKWSDLQSRTGGKPVYRYFFSRARPGTGARGAVHSGEIEYALGNLAGNTVYAWTPDDQKVSALMQDYFANFIKTGDPNGPALPQWPAANRGATIEYMHLDVDSRAEPDVHRARDLFLDQPAAKPAH